LFKSRAELFINDYPIAVYAEASPVMLPKLQVFNYYAVSWRTAAVCRIQE